MAGERDLGRLLASLDVRRREGTFVFVTLPPGTPLPDIPLSALVSEAEGNSLVVRAEDAHRVGIQGEFPAAWLSLTVHSSLDAVGLTASVSTALAVAGIACNVIAGYHHDHLLVPVDRAQDAIAALKALATRPEVVDR